MKVYIVVAERPSYVGARNPRYYGRKADVTNYIKGLVWKSIPFKVYKFEGEPEEVTQ